MIPGNPLPSTVHFLERVLESVGMVEVLDHGPPFGAEPSFVKGVGTLTFDPHRPSVFNGNFCPAAVVAKSTCGKKPSTSEKWCHVA